MLDDTSTQPPHQPDEPSHHQSCLLIAKRVQAVFDAQITKEQLPCLCAVQLTLDALWVSSAVMLLVNKKLADPTLDLTASKMTSLVSLNEVELALEEVRHTLTEHMHQMQSHDAARHWMLATFK